MLGRMLIMALIGVMSPAFAFGQGLDAEAATPYIWRIVVQTKQHPLLTSGFRDGLRRDLLAALLPDIGSLGMVEIVDLAEIPSDQWAPLWRQFVDTGFSALAADPNRELNGVKSHFLKVEIRDGGYLLESRQYDGFSGISSPVVRKQLIRAPQDVGRAAGLMLDRDFGLTGSIESITPTEAKLRIKGGKLGRIERWVKEGDIFAISRITSTNRPGSVPQRTATGKLITPAPGTVQPPALTAAVRDFTFLRIIEAPVDGVARCAILTRYQNALPPGAAGYRALKLSTVLAPVSIRLVGGDGKATSSAVTNVRATESQFGTQIDQRNYLDFQNGLYKSNRPMGGIACVTISLGATREARFPVPIVGPEPVTLQFEVDAKAEDKALFERAVLAASTRAADAWIAQKACFDAVAKLIGAQKNSDALSRAKAGFEAADNAYQVLVEEVKQLKTQPDVSPSAVKLLNSVDQQLGSLQTANILLKKTIADLDAILVKEKDPKNVSREVSAQSVIARISLLLAGGEVDEAISAYDQLITLLPEDPSIKPRRDKLVADWKPKDDAHAKARDYIIKSWQVLATVPDIKESLPQLRNAIEVCKKAGDKYTFRRLLAILGGVPVKLTDLIKDLDPNSPADLKILQDVTAIREVLAPLEKEVIEFIKANP